jgi:hypothetical protein
MPPVGTAARKAQRLFRPDSSPPQFHPFQRALSAAHQRDDHARIGLQVHLAFLGGPGRLAGVLEMVQDAEIRKVVEPKKSVERTDRHAVHIGLFQIGEHALHIAVAKHLATGDALQSQCAENGEAIAHLIAVEVGPLPLAVLQIGADPLDFDHSFCCAHLCIPSISSR